ncbi:MAG: AAA family ATPase, partial [Deltaproteobacteria bacterium]
AGKSSCLRALKSLFFQIPARTDDNFLHPYDKLLIGGRLEEEGGRELTFYRRKKRTADLFDEQDNPLDPALLSPFLHGMEQELFESLYGIDHEALVRGGQDILDQKGDIGQAIFAAGAGLTSLHTVFEELEREGDELFRPRASTKAINEALAHYRDLQTQMKQVLLSSREWEDHRRARQRAERGLEKARTLSKEKDHERSRLQRLQRALPPMAQRKMLLEKIADLGAVVLLPPDFREQRRNLEQERNETQNRLKTARARMDEIQRKKEGVSLQQNLLNRARDIEAMYQRLGEYRKAVADRPRLEGMRISCKSAAGDLLKQVRPDLPLEQAETLRPSLSKRKTIRTLGNGYEALVQQIEQSGREREKYETALAKAEEALSAVPPAGDSRDLTRLLEAALEDCRDELSRLGLWNGSLDQVGRLAVPISETVNRFEEELNALHDRRTRVQKEKEELQEALRGLLTQLQEIQHAGEVPAEKDLVEVRSRRDSGWRLIRRQWIEGEDLAEEVAAFSPEASLPDAYEGLVEHADHTADRLRLEADRVQKHAALQSQIESLEKRRSELDTEAAKREADLSDAERRWQGIWADCGIDPLSPWEMRLGLAGFDQVRFKSAVAEKAAGERLAGFEKVRFKAAEAEKAAGEKAEKEKVRRDLREQLMGELQRSGDKSPFTGHALGPVLLCAETLLDSLKSDQAKREKLESSIEEFRQALKIARGERAEAEEKLNQWKARWTDALIPLGLDSTTLPDEANDVMDTLQGCLEKLDEAEDFRTRIDGIDRDNRAVERDLAHLLEQAAPDLQETEIVQAVSDLQARLNGARQDQAVFQQYSVEINTLEEEVLQAQTRLKSNEEQMGALLVSAGCEKEEDLDEAERRSGDYVQLKEKLADVESTLAQIAEGIPLSELEEQLQAVDPDALPGQIHTLSQEIDGLAPEIEQLSEAIGREKTEMARMDGSGRAAEFAEASEQVLAKLRRLTERFIRIKLSS